MLIASGFAAYAAGLNPATMSDAELWRLEDDRATQAMTLQGIANNARILRAEPVRVTGSFCLRRPGQVARHKTGRLPDAETGRTAYATGNAARARDSAELDN